MADDPTPWEFLEAMSGDGWRVVSDGACVFFPTDSFADSTRLVEAIAEEVDPEGPAPDVDIRGGGVTVRLLTITEDDAGLSSRDLELARRISAVASRQGIAPDPSGIQSVLVVIGSASPREVMPFWQAALGYQRRADSPDEDLIDPDDRGPGIWFEAMEEPRGDGGGAIHLAAWVPYEVAQARVAAALAAGGRLVRDTFAPAWWTLADAAGNEVDIATIVGRDRPPPG